MQTLRLEIDLSKITHNAHTLASRLAPLGISVTGITKATLGCAEVAQALLLGGINNLGDSRIENIKALRLAQLPVPITLIRSPMLSQIKQVVKYADVSFNTEIEVIRRLSTEAQRVNRSLGIVLMVELGDLREGILPEQLIDTVRETLGLPNIVFKGIGTNLACRSGVSPDANNMMQLSRLADQIEETLGQAVNLVSGGNSANLDWALSGADTGRINDLRLGEAILLGCETLHRKPIDKLYTDAITLIAEVIEAKTKPSQPTGVIAQTAFGVQHKSKNRGLIRQCIIAIGIQDIDPKGLRSPEGTEILGASSDHLILEDRSGKLAVGTEVKFQLNYSALLRAMTSPFVDKLTTHASARVGF